MRKPVFLSSIILCLSLLSCNQSKPTNSSQKAATTPANYLTVDLATSATIRGTVRFTGNAPQPVQIDMGFDPACQYTSSGPNMSEQYVVHDGKLANVYIYVKSGLEGKAFASQTTPVVLDQRGCRYIPHVLALTVNQPLRIVNDDPAMHNIHPTPRAPGNHEWNVSQQPKGAPVEKSFSHPEIMMPVQCNQHPWMKAYLNLSATPFYAVSDASGNFEIKGLPPGEYTIAAVHEKAGERTQKVTVGAKESKAIEFSFSVPGGQ